MQVHKKLMQARVKLHATQIKKSGWNAFSEYAYFELGDFLVPALKIFNEVGLCGVVSFTADTASLTITDTDSDAGGQIVITSPMGSAKLKACHEVQNIGAVETFQRRYLWATALEVTEHDALDSSLAAPEDEAKAEPVLTDLRPLLAGVKATKTDADALAYWKNHVGTLAKQQQDYETFKAAVLDHRMTLKAAAKGEAVAA